MLGGDGRLAADELRALVERALAEDLGAGDVTTTATVAEDTRAHALITQKAPGTIYGVDVCAAVFEALGGDARIERLTPEGVWREAGGPVLAIDASARALLTGERTALNFLCHLSGVATLTRLFSDAAAAGNPHTRVWDTRKTLPGLRALQKYAVRVGGGVNHRMGLGDAALIKDNHVAAAGGVVEALRAVRAAAPDLPCEVEVDSLEELDEVLAEGIELVLLDNFPVWQTQIAVQRRDARAPATLLESSGGLSLETAAEYAGTGVDFLAVGALTHSVRVLDIGLDV